MVPLTDDRLPQSQSSKQKKLGHQQQDGHHPGSPLLTPLSQGQDHDPTQARQNDGNEKTWRVL